MSKVDAMRALREARFAARPTSPTRQRVAVQAAPPAAGKAKAAVTEQVPAAETSDGLCGHRNIGGRSCTREADHQKTGTKSHRYG
jgi:hypothetical protein